MGFAGDLSEDLLDLADQAKKSGSVALEWIATVLYYLLPNLEAFNLKNRVTHEAVVAWSSLDWLPMCYALCYGAVLLTVTMVAFARRDLK